MIMSKDKNVTYVIGGIGVDVIVAGILGVMFMDDGVLYVCFGVISVVVLVSNVYMIIVIVFVMVFVMLKDVWVVAVSLMNSGKKSVGAILDVVDEFYGVVFVSESGMFLMMYLWSVDLYLMFLLFLFCVI